MTRPRRFSLGVDRLVAGARRLGDKVSSYVRDARARRHAAKEKVRHPTHFAKQRDRRDARIR